VLQMVAGLNNKYHTLKTTLPMLPTFPTFMQARNLLLMHGRKIPGVVVRVNHI